MMDEDSVNHILYIDDDKGMLRTVSKWFNSMVDNYELETTDKINELYDELANQDYNLLITDLQIPNGKEGMEIAYRAQEEHDIPVIMYTSDQDAKNQFLEQSPDKTRGFLHKSTSSMKELEEEVKKFL